MSVIEISQKIPSFLCNCCQYKTSNKKDYKKHILTPKHQSRINGDNLVMKPLCCNNCDKQYKSAHGLWYHKKKCIKPMKSPEKSSYDDGMDYENMTDKEIIMHLLKQNSDLTQKVIEIASEPKSITHTNSHNKQFNVNFFLNETCKNAMNMGDFVDSLKINTEELENVGKLGYVEGISNIFIRGLRELDETIRPIHCMDKKRETLYIKEDNYWKKDDNQEKMKTVIGLIAHKNFMKLMEWKLENPNHSDPRTKKNTQYLELVKQVFTGITPDDENGINKIIRKLANEVYVDKAANLS
jgi:hypothetical protein